MNTEAHEPNVQLNQNVLPGNKPLSSEKLKVYEQLFSRFREAGFVKSLLVATGINQSYLSRRYGFNNSDVSKVISGDRTTLTIRKAIAQELGLTVGDLWGDDKS